MSFGEYYAGFSGLGQAWQEQQDRADQQRYQQSAADLAGKQLDAYLRAQGGQPQAPLSPLGAPGATPRLPTFTDGGGPAGSYVANLFKRESGGNPNAQASTSSAKGLGQFTDGTWRAVAAQHPDLGLTPDGRTDPDQMLRATKAFTGDNEAILNRAGLPVNDATRYSLHFLGSAGGPKFVAGATSNPDAPAISFVGQAQANANRNVFFNRDGTPKSAGQVMGDFQRSFGGRAAAPQVAQAPVAVPVVGSPDAGGAPDRVAMQMPPMPPPRPADLAAQPEAEDDDGPTSPARPVQVASNGPVQLPPGASGLNPDMPPPMAPRAAMQAVPTPPQMGAPPPQPQMQAPPMQAPAGGRPMQMPAPVMPQPVPSLPAPQAAAASPADMPAPNARPIGFQIPPGASAGAPEAPFVPGSVASPAVQSGRQGDIPAVQGAPRLSPEQAQFLRGQLANPLTRAQAIQTIQGLSTPDKWETKELGGRVVQVNGRGDIRPVQGFERPATLSTMKGSDGNDYTFNPQTGQYTRAIEAKDKAFTDVTDPAQRKAAGVPDWYQGTVQRGPDGHIVYPGAGQQGVTPAQKIQTAAEAKLSENEVQQVIDARNAAQHAGQKLQTLSIVGDAWKRGADNISTGPGAETVLKLKQAAANLGIPVQGVADSEIVQKVGTQLAAQTAKDLTARPTQFDFATMLNNNPGLLISKEGNLALINIGQQQAKRELQISALARKYKVGDNWGDTLDEFERTHPIVSPLTGKPIDPNELIAPQFGAQPGQGGQPTQQGGQPQGQLKPLDDAVRSEARAAIQSGRPAAAVMQRLREHGFDPAGL